jgi:hypothetical protein
MCFALAAHAEDCQVVSQEELTMTSELNAPAESAIYHYRSAARLASK